MWTDESTAHISQQRAHPYSYLHLQLVQQLERYKHVHFQIHHCIAMLQPDSRGLPLLCGGCSFNDVSFHGSGQIPTPNIDAIASRGLKLMNYHVQPVRELNGRKLACMNARPRSLELV